MSLQSELIAAEREMWEGGPQAFRAHLDDRCMVAFGEMSGVRDRDSIADEAEEGRWTVVALEPRGFVQPSDDMASVAYECTAKGKDGKAYHAMVGSSYVKRGEEWKLVFHQQTPLS